MMRFVYAILILIFSSPLYAATYYMCGTGTTCGAGWSNGSDANNGTSKSAPKLTLTGAFDVVNQSDTLIIGNGTYTGASNMIGSYETAVEPAVGTASAYTIIKAENDGGVVFDGQNARWMFYIINAGARYWQFEGIIWQNMTEDTVSITDASYIKFLRCGAGDTAAGNYVNFGTNTDASYILFENCYSWGRGRYKFSTFHSNHIVFRQCVARPDIYSNGGEPGACFTAYSSAYVKFQNCIAVDADQTSAWANIGEYGGAFYVPCTSGISEYVDFDQCIGLNLRIGGGIHPRVNGGPARYCNFRNLVIWDSYPTGSGVEGGTFSYLRGNNHLVNQCTIGVGDTYGSSEFMLSDATAFTLKNTIFYSNQPTGALLSIPGATQDYNSYYGNSNTTGRSGAHDLTAVNPISGSLEYLPRIETGSALKGAGESGADIGANVMTLIGTAGTVWGDTGYATDTGVSMWPFPNEALIKTKMAAYSSGGVSGARGFAASTSNPRTPTGQITLTSYIWEYLGNTGATAGLYGLGQIRSGAYGASRVANGAIR